MKLGIDLDHFHKNFSDADRDECMRWLEALGITLPDEKVTALWILDESGRKVAIQRHCSTVRAARDLEVVTVESGYPIPLRLLVPIEPELTDPQGET